VIPSGDGVPAENSVLVVTVDVAADWEAANAPTRAKMTAIRQRVERLPATMATAGDVSTWTDAQLNADLVTLLSRLEIRAQRSATMARARRRGDESGWRERFRVSSGVPRLRRIAEMFPFACRCRLP
jgi:hypothetical protein